MLRPRYVLSSVCVRETPHTPRLAQKRRRAGVRVAAQCHYFGTEWRKNGVIINNALLLIMTDYH